MRLISWNVNGLRACLEKGFVDSVKSLDADFICIQETKMQEGQAQVDLPDYEEFYCSAEKKGYSGTAIFARKKPLTAEKNFGTHTTEGRAIILEYEGFYLINVYVPNSQDGLKRIDYRMEWEDDFRGFIRELDKKKPVIVCGDMQSGSDGYSDGDGGHSEEADAETSDSFSQPPFEGEQHQAEMETPF